MDKRGIDNYKQRDGNIKTHEAKTSENGTL
jgi:hypothetical protein